MEQNKNDLIKIPTISRTEETKSVYLARAEQLLKRAKKELKIFQDDDLDVRQFVIWLVEKKSTIHRRSWRQYKSAVVYYLEVYENAEIASEALEYIKNINSIGAKTQTDKTSSLKLKKITYDDWKTLDTYLQTKNNKWHEQLRAWLRASILTGLRPIEWRNAVFFMHEEQPALKIQNAKSTNGRSHGETRTLLLKDVNSDDLIAIKAHLNNIRTFKGMEEYEYFYRGCAIALYKACRRCWPRRKKHITLYSTRHQFSANAKSSGFTKMEVAAMMGHAVDITATIHYGRKVAGNETVGISPIDEEVAKVRQVESIDIKNIGDRTIIKKKKTNSDIFAELESGIKKT